MNIIPSKVQVESKDFQEKKQQYQNLVRDLEEKLQEASLGNSKNRKKHSS